MRWLDTMARRLSPGAETTVAERMAAAFDASNRGDYARALEIWGPLARAGVPRAQNKVGACFAEGISGGRDPKRALQWLLAAAAPAIASDYAIAPRSISRGKAWRRTIPERSRYIAPPPSRATCRPETCSASSLLESVADPDYREARRFAGLAHAQGIAASMTRLGMIFHNALGVDRDPAQAVSWRRRGARHGDADGHATLGAAYHLGAGVKRDPIEAFSWLTHARAGASARARGFLDAIRAGLSAQEIAAGERRAATPLAEPSS